MGELPHVHAPQGIHTWRDFFIHIAVVAIGLLLALGLQQTVEFVHHRQERAELEERMRETLEVNRQIIAYDLQGLASVRAYLVELHAAVAAHIDGQTLVATPSPGSVSFPAYRMPNLGALEAAEADGNIALLSHDRIRLYKRIATQTDVISDNLSGYRTALVAFRAFRKRFDPAPSKWPVGLPADLGELSQAQLSEYQALIAYAIEQIDVASMNLGRLDHLTQAVLGGERDETRLYEAQDGTSP